MSEIDRLIGRLGGNLDAIEKRLGRIEQKVDFLQSDLDERRGISRVFYLGVTALGSFAGFMASYAHDLINKT